MPGTQFHPLSPFSLWILHVHMSILCLCATVHKWRSEGSFQELQDLALLPPPGAQGSNSRHQSWQQFLYPVSHLTGPQCTLGRKLYFCQGMAVHFYNPRSYQGEVEQWGRRSSSSLAYMRPLLFRTLPTSGSCIHSLFISCVMFSEFIYSPGEYIWVVFRSSQAAYWDEQCYNE